MSTTRCVAGENLRLHRFYAYQITKKLCIWEHTKRSLQATANSNWGRVFTMDTDFSEGWLLRLKSLHFALQWLLWSPPSIYPSLYKLQLRARSARCFAQVFACAQRVQKKVHNWMKRLKITNWISPHIGQKKSLQQRDVSCILNTNSQQCFD